LKSSETLERLWSLKLDIEFDEHTFRCCSLNYGDWLVLDMHTSCLLHITKDGKLQAASKYEEPPLDACLFNGDKLAVSTLRSINFHELKSVN